MRLHPFNPYIGIASVFLTRDNIETAEDNKKKGFHFKGLRA